MPAIAGAPGGWCRFSTEPNAPEGTARDRRPGTLAFGVEAAVQSEKDRVAICHQTSPRGRPPLEGTVGGVKRRGWDYLSAKLEAATCEDRSLLKPDSWARIDVGEFTAIFRDDQLGERLSEPEIRTAMVQNLGRVMLEHHWR